MLRCEAFKFNPFVVKAYVFYKTLKAIIADVGQRASQSVGVVVVVVCSFRDGSMQRDFEGTE